MNFMKKNPSKIIYVAFISIFPLISFAADINGIPCNAVEPGKISNPIQYCSLIEFIQGFLTGALKIGIPIIALAIIYSGFLFVSAQGKPEAITKAKNALMYTLIGAAILLGSWAIAKLISETVLGLS